MLTNRSSEIEHVYLGRFFNSSFNFNSFFPLPHFTQKKRKRGGGQVVFVFKSNHDFFQLSAIIDMMLLFQKVQLTIFLDSILSETWYNVREH